MTWLCWLPTAGLIYVWYRVHELRYFVSRTRYGALRFNSELSTGSVLGIYLLFYLALSLVVGVATGLATGLMPALSSAYQDLASADTAAILANDLTVNLILIAVIALVVVALGMVRILFYVHPMFRVVCNSLKVAGEEDYAAIAQSQQLMPGRGEGFADALDVGAF